MVLPFISNKRYLYFSCLCLLCSHISLSQTRDSLYTSRSSLAGHNLAFVSVGMNIPTGALSDFKDIGQYRNPGFQLSVSHALLFGNQGIINTFFYTRNAFNAKKQASDIASASGVPDTSITVTADPWQHYGILTGYFHRYSLSRVFCIDWRIQGGIVMGNYPLREVKQVFSAIQYADYTYQYAMSTGMMAVTGIAFTFKPKNDDPQIRLGIDYSIGQITHVFQEQELDARPYTPSYTYTNSTGVDRVFYWGLNITLGLTVNLDK